MSPDEFIDAIRIVVRDAAAKGCVSSYENPPGRAPSQELLDISHWYLALPSSDKLMVQKVIRDATHFAVFQFLCVLDGVGAIENRPDKGELRLMYVRPPIEVRLNDPNDEDLHDRFNSR